MDASSKQFSKTASFY